MRILNTASVDRSKFQEYKSEAKPGWTSGKKKLDPSSASFQMHPDDSRHLCLIRTNTNG